MTFISGKESPGRFRFPVTAANQRGRHGSAQAKFGGELQRLLNPVRRQLKTDRSP